MSIKSFVRNISRDARRLMLRVRPQQSVKIVGRALHLDTANRHERRYYEDTITCKHSIDDLIAERCVRPGDVALDAGANIGFVSLTYLARGAGEVHAVEPIADLYARLARLQDTQLRTYRVALSDRDGETEIFHSQSHNQGHTVNPAFLALFPAVFGTTPSTETVQLARADTLFGDKHFDFMKIDIEGSEAAFINGARVLFEQRPPRAVQIEIYPSEFADVDARLRRYFPYAWRVVQMGSRVAFLEQSAEGANPPIYVYAASPELSRF